MARTVQKIRIALALLLSLFGGTMFGGTDTVSTAHRLLYLSSEDTLSSGGYALGDGQKAGVLFFPFAYELSPDDISSLYLNASPGYGAAQYGTGAWMKLYGLKLGGGLRYSTGVNSALRIGGSYQLTAFDPATGITGKGYDVTAAYSYRLWYGEWNPYATTELRYYGTSVTQGNTTDTTHSQSARAQIGLVTPALFHPFDLPMRLEVYGGGIYFHGDLPRILQTRYLTYAGVKTYLQSPILSDYISDITFSVQAVRGKDFRGFNLGVGVKF